MKQWFRDGHINPDRNCPFSSSRWENPPTFSTQREVLKLFALTDWYSTEGKSRFETVRSLQTKQEAI